MVGLVPEIYGVDDTYPLLAERDFREIVVSEGDWHRVVKTWDGQIPVLFSMSTQQISDDIQSKNFRRFLFPIRKGACYMAQ